MNDDEFLTQFREPPRREFAQELYQRINSPMYKKSPPNLLPFQRMALGFSALLLVLLATIAFSPQVRASAVEQIRQIGAFIFAPTENLERDASLPQPTAAAPGESEVQFATSPAEAARLAGFPVLAPTYLPQGYAQQGEWAIATSNEGIYVVTTYRPATGDDFLILNQTRFEPATAFEQTYGSNETLHNTTVAGHPAVFISGRLMAHPDTPATGADQQPELLATNWLVWEASGQTFSLYGTGLDQTEMVRIAESLGR